MPPHTYADLLSLIKPNDPGGPINAPFLPPTATWEDAKRDPIKTLADLIIGAVDPWNQPKGLNAGSLGGLLGAMVPLLKAGKLAEAMAAEKAGTQSAANLPESAASNYFHGAMSNCHSAAVPPCLGREWPASWRVARWRRLRSALHQ